MKLKKPHFWDNQKISLWSIILYPLSLIYLFVHWINRFSSNLKSYEKPNIPVICVGNIYVGGTGKTPLVREIFNITKSFGKNPAFIKKKYEYLDDEINMLKRTGDTYTDRDRNSSVIHASSNNNDVAILDDGFQDFSIKPDFSILCFNSKQTIGNGFVMPAGPLRESLNAINRANCIVINGQKNFKLEKEIIKHSRDKKIPIFYSKYKIREIDKFKNEKITAFAGIGNPSNFFDLLKKNNLNVEKTFSFPDHHKYSEKEFNKIIENNNSKILTTEKDYYRLTDSQKIDCHYVSLELEIENKDEFIKVIKSYL